VFGPNQNAEKPSNWHEQLDHTEWTENVMKHIPTTRARRLLKKQGKDEAFSSIAEVAEE
jgi:hypothetical protein